ncbi:MAG: hypothetical protein LBR10_10280 [Prevotellaceae bacterium]|jgi:hypothetical protein|nr:hypothetical protein [Prevotellaceae bacterium]
MEHLLYNAFMKVIGYTLDTEMDLRESAKVIDATCCHYRRKPVPPAGICFISEKFVYTFVFALIVMRN